MQLEINRLSHWYDNDKVALDNLSLTLKPGIIGLLGPNGAGKSTLMRILATMGKPSTGSVFWRDQDTVKNPDALRQELGYLPQSFGVYENLSARDFLLYLAALKDIPTKLAGKTVDKLLEQVNLNNVANNSLKGFSGGMRQRIGIAQALLNDPKLLIVDEPTVGLDPEERARFRQILSELAGERVIILSTHIVSDVESIADQIAIINAGKLLSYSSPKLLLSKIKKSVWSCVVSYEDVNLLAQQYCISHSVKRFDGFHLTIVCEHKPVPNAINIEASLEDAFLFYTHSKRQGATNVLELSA